MMLTQRSIICCYILAFALVSCGSAEPRVNSQNTEATTISTNKNMVIADQDRVFFKNLPKGFAMPKNDAERLLLKEYGSVFVSRGGATPPSKIVFEDEAAVTAFQDSLTKSTENVGGTSISLQAVAMKALQEAREEAKKSNLSIGPRGGDSAKRGYKHTVDLWASRVNPGFVYWTGKGRVSKSEAARIKALTPYEQVPEILKLEQDKIFFAKTLDKSIIYSVAPPGTSQHISMLALDVSQFENARVREILANHGWFQTVTSDLPHFTYLGVTEKDLPGLGLKQVTNSGRVFWVPDI